MCTKVMQPEASSASLELPASSGSLSQLAWPKACFVHSDISTLTLCWVLAVCQASFHSCPCIDSCNPVRSPFYTRGNSVTERLSSVNLFYFYLFEYLEYCVPSMRQSVFLYVCEGSQLISVRIWAQARSTTGACAINLRAALCNVSVRQSVL